MELLDLQPLEIAWMLLVFAQAILVLATSLFFIREARRSKDMKSLASYYRGMIWFFFFLGLNGVFDSLEQYARYVGFGNAPSSTGLFPEQYQVLPALQPPTLTTTTTFFAIISLLMLSFAILSYPLETYILQSKRRPRTIILLICFVVSLAAFVGNYFNAATQILISQIVNLTLIPFAIIIAYWGIYYLVLAKRTLGSIRHKAVMVGLGLGFMMGGIIFDILYRVNVSPILWIIPLGCRAVGVLGIVMLVFGFRREQGLS
jgi:hypothetical protein